VKTARETATSILVMLERTWAVSSGCGLQNPLSLKHHNKWSECCTFTTNVTEL